jgi:hypothetical protein
MLVFIGRGIGAAMRHSINVVFLRWLGTSFPFHTLFENVSGSLIMGLLDGYFAFRDRLGHGPAGPMSGLARRIGAGQGQHLGDRRHRDRHLAGLAAPLAQEPRDALLGIMLLPALHRRAADAGFAGDLQRRQPVGRVKDDPGALRVLERPVSIADDRAKARAIFDRDNHRNGLRHAGRIARPAPIVNLEASVRSRDNEIAAGTQRDLIEAGLN